MPPGAEKTRKNNRSVCQIPFMGFQRAGIAPSLPHLTETMLPRPEMLFRNGNRNQQQQRHRPTGPSRPKSGPLPHPRQFQRSRQLPGITRQLHPPRRCSLRVWRSQSKAPPNMPFSRGSRLPERRCSKSRLPGNRLSRRNGIRKRSRRNNPCRRDGRSFPRNLTKRLLFLTRKRAGGRHPRLRSVRKSRSVQAVLHRQKELPRSPFHKRSHSSKKSARLSKPKRRLFRSILRLPLHTLMTNRRK